MKILIKKIFRILGIEVSFRSIKTKPRYEFFDLLKQFNVDLIYDIGANIGQFGSEMREVGFKGQIISFEPLPKEHSALREKAADDQKWIVNEQCAIGDVDDYVDINISGNSVSSSILPMAEIHAQAASTSSYVDKVRVPLRRLDTAAQPYKALGNRYFIKIDTQGFEWQVLDGASEILKNAIGIQVELSLVHLYEGQKLWMDVIGRLENEGFALWTIQPGFTDPLNKRLLQCDGTFIRLPLPI